MAVEVTSEKTLPPSLGEGNGETAAIRKAAVLGAGTMGSRIAAHLANAGIPVVLLDIATPGGNTGERSKPAVQALDQLKRAKPAAFFDPSAGALIRTGNFEDDLALLCDCDWVIEAVTEDLAIKQALLHKAAPFLKPDVFFTTNTSGLPVASIARNLAEPLRRRWFGTHFFNPPRYMRLVEFIATPETDPSAMDAVARFADRRLGKEVVEARDTPNFIANRIGVFLMLETVRLMQAEDLTVEEVDALTGSVLGFPRTGTFRLSDMVGLDILAHVAANFAEARADLREQVALPPFIRTMLERRWLGDKTGKGFYKKERDDAGKDIRLVLDVKALEYRPLTKAKLPSLDLAKGVEDLPGRLRQLLSGDIKNDKAARFHWKLLSALWNYAADCLPEIAGDAASVDRAMRAGFNWELGPFELWDAAGVVATVDRMKAAGAPVSVNVERLLAAGATAWYRNDGAECFDLASGEYRPARPPQGLGRISAFRRSHGILKQNAGASLIDLGEGVAVIELHAKKSVLGEDVLRMIVTALEPQSDAVRNFRAFVIASDAAKFSVGANLMLLLLSAQEGEWEELEASIRGFQRMTQTIKFCPRPVVVAPYSMCLGGGAEIALHAARNQVHAELYMGLVEAGVGLIPAGGGTKEMVLRTTEAAARTCGDADRVAFFPELTHAMSRTFETIALAKVSTSAREARHLGLLRREDGITLNRDRLLQDAKQAAKDAAEDGYVPPLPRTDIPAAGESVLATLKLGAYLMRQAGYASDHDVKVANLVAHILCGGQVAPGTRVTEQYLLDLEREAFLSLCGERKTQERIAFTLRSGKPLRN